MAQWTVSGKVTDQLAEGPLVLRVQSYATAPVRLDVVAEAMGLRRLRSTSLESDALLKPGQTRDFVWAASTAPLQPVGSSIEPTGRIAWHGEVPAEAGGTELVTGMISAEHAFVRYSADYKRLFVSADDDLGVRLASIATTEIAERAQASRPASGRLAAVFEMRDHPRGKVDALEPTEKALSESTEEATHSDSLRLTAEWDVAFADASKIASRGPRDPSVPAQPGAMKFPRFGGPVDYAANAVSCALNSNAMGLT